MPCLVEIGSVVPEKRIFKFCQCIFAISLLTSVRKKRDPLFEQTLIPFTKRYFVPKLIEIDTVVLEKNFVNVFRYFVLIFPWKWTHDFI